MSVHDIPLSEAVALTTLYRQNRETVLDPAFRGQDILALCETFSRDLFDELLAEEGAASIRIFYGMDPSFKVHAVIVAADAAGKDILPAGATLASGGGGGSIGEDGNRCPPICPPGSPLNGGH